MRYTETLKLPIYDNPEADLFKLNEWNNGNLNIENKIKEFGSFLQQITEENIGSVHIKKFGAKLDGITDDTIALKNLISYCEGKNITGIIEGGTLSVSEIVVGSNIMLDFKNTPIILRNGSNKPILRNKNISFDYYNKIDSNIKIKGGIWDCNGDNQTNTETDGTITCGFRFTGVKNIEFNPIKIINPRRYAMFFVNVDGFKSEYIEIDFFHETSTPNRDGFHIGGKCEQFYINTLKIIKNGDDAFPLNATDVAHGGQYTSENISGNILNIYLNNLYVYGKQGVRFLAGLHNLDGIYINNFKGDISDDALLCEDYGLGTNGSVKNAHIGIMDINYVEKKHDYKGYFIRLANMGSNSNLTIGRLVRNQIGATNGEDETISWVGVNGIVNINELIEKGIQSTYSVNITEGGFGINKLTINQLNSVSNKTNRIMFNISGTLNFGELIVGNVDSTYLINFLNISNPNVNMVSVTNSAIPTTDYFIAMTGSTLDKLNINGVFHIKALTGDKWVYKSNSTINKQLINGSF